MSLVPYLNLIERLKTTPRTGWLNEEISHPESIADHMYRMALITMLCRDPTLDKEKMLKIALVHDMAEAVVGDITPLDNVPKERKRAMELAAMKGICEDLLPSSHRITGEEMMALFLEYEHRSTPEARFVKDVDKFELVLQTFEYEKAGRVARRLDHFVASHEQVQHEEVKGWCADVMREREAWWAAKEAARRSSSQ